MKDCNPDLARRVQALPHFDFFTFAALHPEIFPNLEEEAINHGKMPMVERPIYFFELGNKGFWKKWADADEWRASKLSESLGIGPTIYGPACVQVEQNLESDPNPYRTPQEMAIMVGQVFRLFHEHDLIYADPKREHYILHDGRLKVIDYNCCFFCKPPEEYDSNRVFSIQWMTYINMLSYAKFDQEFMRKFDVTITGDLGKTCKLDKLTPEFLKATSKSAAVYYLAESYGWSSQWESNIADEIKFYFNRGYNEDQADRMPPPERVTPKITRIKEK